MAELALPQAGSSLKLPSGQFLFARSCHPDSIESKFVNHYLKNSPLPTQKGSACENIKNFYLFTFLVHQSFSEGGLSFIFPLFVFFVSLSLSLFVPLSLRPLVPQSLSLLHQHLPYSNLNPFSIITALAI